MINFGQSRLADPQNTWHQYAFFGGDIRYRIRINGELENDRHADVIPSVDDAAFASLVDALADRSARDRLQLSDEQHQLIDNIVIEWRQLQAQWEVARQSFHGRKRDFNEQWSPRIRQIRDDSLVTLGRSFSQPQRTELERIGYQTGLARLGLLHVVSYGDLSREMQLSEDQRERLGQEAESQRTRITEVLKLIETRLNQLLLEKLSDDQYRELEELIGPPLDVFIGNVELHALLMSDLKTSEPLVQGLLSELQLSLDPFLPQR
jgi:hypothetical protein